MCTSETLGNDNLQVCLFGRPTPEGWRIVRISDVFSRVTRRIETHGLPVLTISAKIGFMTQEERYSRFMAGDSLRRYIELHHGEFAYNKGNSKTFPQGCVYPLKDYAKAAVPHVYFCFRNRVHVDVGFFAQYFASGALNEQLARLNNTGVRNNGLLNIDAEQFFSMEIPFPPLDEQRKIATALSSVDDAIKSARTVFDQTRRVKKGLLHDLLTRGIGHSHFKNVGKWKVGRLPGISEIPVAWEITRLIDVAKLESGHTPSRKQKDYWGGNVPWLSLHDSKSLGHREIFNTAEYITELGILNSSARLLPAGTVAFSRTASVGHCVIMSRSMATSQDFANYICSERLHNRYLMHLFRWMQPIWKRLASGSTHQTVYMPTFEQLQILLPPLEEQVRIAEIADAVDDLLEQYSTEIEAMQETKRGLMQDLLTGQVRVPTGV